MGAYKITNLTDITVERQLDDGSWIPASPIEFYPNIFIRLWRQI